MDEETVEGRRWGASARAGGMDIPAMAALLESSLCSLPAPSAEWRWKTGTKQGWLTGRVIPGPWIQRNSSSDLGNFA